MSRINRIWSLIEDVTSGLLISVAALLTFYNVFMRYVFQSPVNWVSEVVRFMVIWGAFIGAAVALRENSHIKVDLLYAVLPRPMKKVVSLFANTVGLMFSLFLIWQGSILVSFVKARGQVSFDVEIPMFLVYLAVPIGGLFLAIRFLERIYKIFVSPQTKELGDGER
ncbi:TRAP transporter small permease [Calderihabitans maritimus]|uniref:Tripartite AtP-independent periplasmic transporter subunit DctQ n=1 Tax=Calderihabitans maritimus TaxID=1246530 RepID=A0A1Z5HTQ8_9FIRM|nr:TRAP transporter small permease [Calderihabitans maritimus]GAW92808.1 tripartite AtP-independent periplasmic transporter subunit DctQ [Calderihabitans maritimus]